MIRGGNDLQRFRRERRVHATRPGGRGQARLEFRASELQERELIKLASLAAAIAEALRQRGVKDPVASLAPK